MVKKRGRGMCSRTRVEMIALNVVSWEVVVVEGGKESRHSNLSDVLLFGCSSGRNFVSAISSIPREKSRPITSTTLFVGQVWDSSFAVLRPVPQPRSSMDMLLDGLLDVTWDRNWGSKVPSSRSSIACSMLPSVS